MRILKIDLSNKLTDYGVELLYRKLFDKHVEFDQVFYTDIETLRKLRLYHTSGFVESDREELSIVNYEYLEIRYYYDNLPPLRISHLVLEDSGYRRIMDIESQYLTISDTGSSTVSCIICKFVIDRNNNKPNSFKEEMFKWIPVTITDYGNRFIYESLANIRNEKVDFIFSGDGEPDNSPANFHIDHLLDDTKVQNVLYYDRYCLLSGRKLFPYNTVELNELGLGFYLRQRRYLRNYVATMDKDWKGRTFPIDRSARSDPNTLEYDHPVLSLRLTDEDYACVWYSGNKNFAEDSIFPNLSFSAKFYINLLYQIITDEEPLEWRESTNLHPISDRMGTSASQTINKTDHLKRNLYGGAGIAFFDYCNIIRGYNDLSFDTSVYEILSIQTDPAETIISKTISPTAYANSEDKIFSYSVMINTNNFFRFDERTTVVYLPRVSSPDTIYVAGEDYEETYSQTEENNIITITWTVTIPTTSRIATDIAGSVYYLYLKLTIPQNMIQFTEGADYTITPGTASGKINVINIEGGRLYRSYGRVNMIYDNIPS